MSSSWSYTPKRSIRVQIRDFCPVWPWNFTDNLEKQYTMSSFVRYFKAMDEFNLESQSRNAQLFCVISITNKLGIDSFDAIAVMKIEENGPMKRRAAASE